MLTKCRHFSENTTIATIKRKSLFFRFVFGQLLSIIASCQPPLEHRFLDDASWSSSSTFSGRFLLSVTSQFRLHDRHDWRNGASSFSRNSRGFTPILCQMDVSVRFDNLFCKFLCFHAFHFLCCFCPRHCCAVSCYLLQFWGLVFAAKHSRKQNYYCPWTYRIGSGDLLLGIHSNLYFSNQQYAITAAFNFWQSGAVHYTPSKTL